MEQRIEATRAILKIEHLRVEHFVDKVDWQLAVEDFILRYTEKQIEHWNSQIHDFEETAYGKNFANNLSLDIKSILFVLKKEFIAAIKNFRDTDGKYLSLKKICKKLAENEIEIESSEFFNQIRMAIKKDKNLFLVSNTAHVYDKIIFSFIKYLAKLESNS